MTDSTAMPAAPDFAAPDDAVAYDGVTESEADEAHPPAMANGDGHGPRKNEPSSPKYGRLDATDRALVGEWIGVIVGLADSPQPGVAGRELAGPDKDTYDLEVEVSAYGFDLKEGQRWRHELHVSPATPEPEFQIDLRAQPISGTVEHRSITAKYGYKGQPIGFAERSIVVAKTAAAAASTEPVPIDPRADMGVPTDAPQVDLTVTISVLRSDVGLLGWQFDVGNGLSLKRPDGAVYTEIGSNPKTLAQQLMDEMGALEQKPGLYLALIGTGRTIRDNMPAEFWTLLRAVAEKVSPRSPTVLIHTQEPYVPWELAVMEPPLDSGSPPFLAAQATVSRWVFGRGVKPRPPVPPRHSLPAKRMAVVVGEYKPGKGPAPLKEAEIEGAELVKTYAATAFKADKLDELLENLVKPGADLIHFACHGKVDLAYGVASAGLILNDGTWLLPNQVKGLPFKNAPFVFLNACQIGTANETLGDYAGMAESFLYAGAGGVLAPLWKISDAVAREVALAFYKEALKDPARPAADIIREQRAQLRDTPAAQSGTWMAYVFFGHPQMRLAR